jgi:hypothetical protein
VGVNAVLTSNISEVIDKIDDTIRDRMQEAVNEVRSKTLETLSGTRTGRIYKVPGTNTYYTASSPGEAPAQATGDLRESIKTEIEGEGEKTVGMVGTDMKKGPMLEYGTKNMAARPWLRRSFEESEGKVKEIFSRKWF